MNLFLSSEHDQEFSHHLLQDLTRSDYNNQINRALDNLAREVGNVNEVYTLAVATYCFSLAQHPSRNTLFNRLISLAKVDGESPLTHSSYIYAIMSFAF